MLFIAVIVTIRFSTALYLSSLYGVNSHYKRSSIVYSNSKYSSRPLVAMASTDKIEDNLIVSTDIVEKAALSLQKYFFSVDLKTKSMNYIMPITIPFCSVVCTLLYYPSRYDD